MRKGRLEVFVIETELDDKFPVHVFRGGVVTSHTVTCDDDGPDQTGVDVFALVYTFIAKPFSGSTPTAEVIARFRLSLSIVRLAHGLYSASFFGKTF